MTEIDMRCTPRVLIGPLSGLGTSPDEWGNRALLLADKALEAKGINTIIFAREGLASDTSALDEALSLARGSHAGMIAALGGEKVLSLGRLTAAASPGSLSGTDLISGGFPEGSGLPVLEIPSSGRHTLLFRKEALLNDPDTGRAVLVPLGIPPEELVIFPWHRYCTPVSRPFSLPGRITFPIYRPAPQYKQQPDCSAGWTEKLLILITGLPRLKQLF